jgi:hypothetical protein
MAEYPYGVSEGLSGDDRARLESTEVALGYGHTRTAADLIVGYAARVNRLDAEHALHPGDDRDLWNAHDLVGTLIIRDMAERGLDLLDGELRSRVASAVARVDERLRSFTEPDERRLVHRFAGEDAGHGWWWNRIPRSGPIRTELLRFAERTGSL